MNDKTKEPKTVTMDLTPDELHSLGNACIKEYAYWVGMGIHYEDDVNIGHCEEIARRYLDLHKKVVARWKEVRQDA